MYTAKTFVENLSEEDRIQIIKDMEIFNDQGWIADSTLRKSAEILAKDLNDINYATNSVFWMKTIFHEVCYYYTKKYLGEI